MVAGLLFCSLARADDIEVGLDWIQNETAKVSLEHENSSFQKYYCMRYWRRADKTGEWRMVLIWQSPLKGMGYYLLVEKTPIVWVKTEKTERGACLKYRLEGMATQPAKPIWAEFRLALFHNSPCVVFEMSACSDTALSLMCRIGGQVPLSHVGEATRYLIYDKAIDPKRYAVEVVDAADRQREQGSLDYHFSRFSAAYNPNNGFLCVLFGLSVPPSDRINRIQMGRGPGFGGFEFYQSYGIYGEYLSDLKGIENISFLVEQNYYKFYSLWSESAEK